MSISLSSPDERDMHIRCYNLSALYSKLARGDEGMQMYQQALSAEERFMYLYGKPQGQAGRSQGLEASLRAVADRSFGSGAIRCAPLSAFGSTPKSNKLRPNDRCDCGSGRKFKKCCGSHQRSHSSTKPKVKDAPAAAAAMRQQNETTTRDAKAMQHLMQASTSAEMLSLRIRASVAANGTDVDLNDADPFGDGDQSILTDENSRQVHRDIWCVGGDVEACTAEGVLSEFGMMCMVGAGAAVGDRLQSGFSKQLLEQRETSLRLSPLLLTLCGCRTVMAGPGMNSTEHEDVMKQLLEAGARPDARCIVGKTVVHYGAGSQATDTSLRLVEHCIDAAQGLGTRLVNIQDRTGALALHEVVMANRVDVAKFLLKHGADPCIEDADGCSPQGMNNPLFNLEMSRMFSKEASKFMKKTRVQEQNDRVCTHCGAKPEKSKLQVCSKCRQAWYCSAACQREVCAYLFVCCKCDNSALWSAGLELGPQV